MIKTKSNIRFKAKLLRPAEPPKEGSWTFLILPKDASAKSHWLKVHKKMRKAAGAEVGDVVPLEILSVGKEPEPRVPADLRKALAAAPEARAAAPD